jgi:hypothetical protein
MLCFSPIHKDISALVSNFVLLMRWLECCRALRRATDSVALFRHWLVPKLAQRLLILKEPTHGG